jgi:hypothetical protein
MNEYTLPCPFCGSDKKIALEHDTNCYFYLIELNKTVTVSTEDLIGAWNRRYAESKQRSQLNKINKWLSEFPT